MLDENNNVVFPYQVNTIMPITGLSIGSIMVPSTVKLTKDDVIICIKKAPVFRRFQNGKLVRVTISSVDRLHNENLMSDKEYEDFIDKQSDKRGKVSDVEVKKEKPVVKEEPVKEEAPVVEEPVEEIPVEEVKVEEADTAMDEITDQTEEPVTETTEDIINDEGISEDVTESVDSEESSKSNQKNNRYNNKKKHNR